MICELDTDQKVRIETEFGLTEENMLWQGKILSALNFLNIIFKNYQRNFTLPVKRHPKTSLL